MGCLVGDGYELGCCLHVGVGWRPGEGKGLLEGRWKGGVQGEGLASSPIRFVLDRH